MKTFFAIINGIFHRKKGHETWNNYKYLLILTYKKYDIPHLLGDEPCYLTAEFKSKQEALSYIENHVSKSQQNECCLYKEIKLKVSSLPRRGK